MAGYVLVALGLVLAPIVIWRDPAPGFVSLAGMLIGYSTVQLLLGIAGRDRLIVFQQLAESFALGVFLYTASTLGKPSSWVRIGIFAGSGLLLGLVAMGDAVRCRVFSEVGTKKAVEPETSGSTASGPV